MSAASGQKRRALTIALGVVSAVTFGGMYGVIARGSGGGTETQAAMLELDQTTYTELTTPDANIAPATRHEDEDDDDEGEHESDDDGGEHESDDNDEGEHESDDNDEGEGRASVATAAPSRGNTISPVTAPRQAPVATQQPVTRTRGS